MAVTQPRTKLVNFRLSQEEFESLKYACGSLGARSMSEFARTAVLSKSHPAAAPDTTHIARINDRVGELESIIGQLMRQLGVSPQAAMGAAAGASSFSFAGHGSHGD